MATLDTDATRSVDRSVGRLVGLDAWDTMTSLTEEDTGIWRTIFLIMRHAARHGPRIKVAVDPARGLNSEVGVTVYTVGDNPRVARGCRPLPAPDERDVIRFIRLNRATIERHYNGEISGSGAVRAIRSIAPRPRKPKRPTRRR
jgi:hypothetical protein